MCYNNTLDCNSIGLGTEPVSGGKGEETPLFPLRSPPHPLASVSFNFISEKDRSDDRYCTTRNIFHPIPP